MKVLSDIFSYAANNFVGILRQSEEDIQKSREGEREREGWERGGREKFRLGFIHLLYPSFFFFFLQSLSSHLQRKELVWRAPEFLQAPSQGAWQGRELSVARVGKTYQK
jgi:hypothetical protein